MAAATSLSYKLLDLFPIKVLRDNFETKGRSQDDVINDIINKKTEKEIGKFVAEKFGFTKQHVHILTVNKAIKIAEIEKDFPFKIHEKIKDDLGDGFLILPTVTFQVTFISPYEARTMKFVQPIIISFYKKHIIFRFVILQKNFTSYADAGQQFVQAKRNINEKGIIKKILNKMPDEYNFESTDLHKGVKKLLEDEKIDGTSVKYRGAVSTTTEAMNEGFTLKKHHPERYAELVNSPMSKTAFKSFVNDESLTEIFNCDPGIGEVSINRYPANEKQIINVIREIISHN